MSITEQNQTPIEQSYAQQMRVALQRVERLAYDKKHGAECQCKTCREAWDIFQALQENPPCNYCYGYGCGMCDHTGWR